MSEDPLVLARKSYFRNLIARAAGAGVAADLLRPIVSFLQNDAELVRLRQRLGEEAASPDENAVFAVEGVQPLDNAEVQAFWRRERARASSGQGRKAMCLVTGLRDARAEVSLRVPGRTETMGAAA